MDPAPDPSSPTTAVVVGSLNADRVLRVPALPREGETLSARSVTVLPGGKGANQAVALARLGCAVRMVGAVGDDAEGRLLRAALDEEGVDTTGVHTAEAPTGTAVVTVDDAGDNMIVVHAGANEALDAPALPSGPVDLALLQLELPLAVVSAALRRLRPTTGRLVLNAAPPVPLDTSLLALVDVVVVNEHEALVVTGAADLDQALGALAGAVRELAVVTLGSRGGMHLGATPGAEPGRWSASPVEAVVDTTGAGDCFVAALATGLARGLAPADAARLAADAAALAVSRSGAQAGMPHLAELPGPGSPW